MKNGKRKVLGSKEMADVKTGEVDRVLILAPEGRLTDTDTHLKVFQLFSRKVIQDLLSGLGAGTCSTLFWIMDRMMYFEINEIPILAIYPEELAEETGVGLSTARLHIKKLKEFGYIKQIRPRDYNYWIDPNMIFKGTKKQFFEKHVLNQFDTNPHDVRQIVNIPKRIANEKARHAAEKAAKATEEAEKQPGLFEEPKATEAAPASTIPTHCQCGAELMEKIENGEALLVCPQWGNDFEEEHDCHVIHTRAA